MIVLDTHIWIWWLNGDKEKLGDRWSDLICGSDDIAISAISCFEVAWLERHDRIELPVVLAAWFDKAIAGSGIRLEPITPLIAQIAVDLPAHHSDPQDRLIMATAIANKASLISADAKFDLYSELDDLRVGRLT